MRHILLRTILATAVLFPPAAASAGVSLSPIMESWSHDKRDIEAMLTGRRPYDGRRIREELQRYIASAATLARAAHGSSAAARDFAARFDAFATDGRAALGTADDASATSATFDRMLGDCRSCHAIYNN